MKQLNKCAARYDSNTLISYSTLIYKRCNRYTVVYRYHSATTTQHFYKFCDKIGIERNSARALWNGRGYVAVYDRATGELIEYSTEREYMEEAFRRLPDGEDMPELGYGITNI